MHCIVYCVLQARDLEDPRIDLMTSASERGELLSLSPLFIATEMDRLDLVKDLIGKGANPLDRNESKATVVYTLCCNEGQTRNSEVSG